MTVLLPRTIDEAVTMLQQGSDITIVGGGTDVMVEVNFNHRKPNTVMALRNISELFAWSVNESNSEVFIGAGVPYKTMEHGPLREMVPALSEAARTVGSPQIRAAGSIGGNLGTCSPAGDSLPVLAALDALVHLVSATSERQVPISEFMIGPKRNCKLSDELITGVTIPIQRGRQGYAKVGVRNAMVISVASACYAFQDGSVRLALGSVGPTVLRCPQAEAFANSVVNSSGYLSENDAQELGRLVSAESRPIDDHRSTASYRRHAVGVLAQRLSRRGAPQ